MERWWCRVRGSIKGVLFPIICLQFVRTLLLPTAFDVFLLFVLFLIFIGFLWDVY
ncbi:hypothetical protein M3661_26400 [Paenibacillus sp. MER 180]|jgi:hypothetical protein|uniref:Transmembrane protein n=2 Tax=Paenibacillus TaxID=44249 RepID=A0AAJ2N4P8_9BACL|nr:MULTISPECIES: hypothetical protein [Paenibacillus]MCM3293638.1 hypothetical protein [Paenibacillus sp. MER 180]MCY9527754.1 hypothetical protein [Paenibacillus alvei]MDT8979723.1 hypothetical protein [Paenibacillus sp. chi10]SDF92776.1 hypothetical protein SAMN04488689_10831 [Paenibacillus sp. cl6col]